MDDESEDPNLLEEEIAADDAVTEYRDNKFFDHKDDESF